MVLNADCWSRCQVCWRDSSAWGQSKTKTAVGANTAVGVDFAEGSTETSDVFKKFSDIFSEISHVFGKISDVFWKNSNVFSGCSNRWSGCSDIITEGYVKLAEPSVIVAACSVVIVHKWERTCCEGLSAAIHNTKSKGLSIACSEESAFSTEEASGR